jgi:hypothetical protein
MTMRIFISTYGLEDYSPFVCNELYWGGNSSHGNAGGVLLDTTADSILTTLHNLRCLCLFRLFIKLLCVAILKTASVV